MRSLSSLRTLRGSVPIRVTWGSISYIKASILGYLEQVFGEQRKPSEFILFAAARDLFFTCGKRVVAAKRTVRRKKKVLTRFYRSGSTR